MTNIRKRRQLRWFRPSLFQLENRLTPVAPATPVIIEPFSEGQITGTFDINMQTAPEQYFDADGHTWAATDWKVRETSSQTTVWQLPFTSSPPLTFYRVDFSDGAFVGTLAGKTELNYNTNYQLVVKYRDSNNEVSAEAVRNFRTAGANTPVPNAGTWLVRPGYALDIVQTGTRLPVNIAFVPNPGTNPSDPLYYINELYGSIKVVRRDGTMSSFATGLLDYNPTGPISGTGEQGLAGLAVERDSVNPAIYHLYVGMLWDNGAPAGAPNHYPKVERLDSAAGGLTMASRNLLLNMQPEIQGQSHIISNISIGPDNKLYVHMGDGFDATTSLNLDMYRGKVLRMNKDGTPVVTGDPAGANPFYDPANGINSRDYVFTYGHRNPFGGAWRPGTNEHWVVENGNSLDRMEKLVAGTSYGWAGNDATHTQYSDFIWNPATAPVNIAFVGATVQGGSQYPASSYGHAYVSLSGSTYAAGPIQRAKAIVEFTDLDTHLPPVGANAPKLAVQPTLLVKYNGTGRATVAALASGPDGLYFSDLYEDTGASGATAAGANIYRVRYVGDAGGTPPTIDTPAAANPSPVVQGSFTQLSALGADDGGEPNLTYTWGLIGAPPAGVVFSANGTNAAKNVSATFTANGTYSFFVAVRDVAGQSAISNVTVNVSTFINDTGNGVSGQYWNNIDFTGTTASRTDPTINFNWGAGAPVTGFGTNTFSARWTGFILPRFTQTYTFYTTSDDGARLWINNLATGSELVNAWFNQSATQSYTGTIALTAGVFYQIKMEYYEDQGDASVRLEWSSASQAKEIVPQGRLFTAVPTAPAAPTALNLASPTSSQINLSWTDNANNEGGFKIERSTNGTNFSLVATVGQNVTTFNNVGLNPGTLYYYRVRASNAAGDSNFAAGNLPTRPMAPQGFAVDPGNMQNSLSWLASTGATSYRIYRGTTQGGQGGTPIATVASPNYLDSPLTNGQNYFYKVTAVNAGGESLASEETNGTPLFSFPIVTSFVINDGQTQRSRLTSLTVTFSQIVTLPATSATAFEVRRQSDNALPILSANVNNSGPGTVITLTFAAGAAVDFGSLADGRYTFTILAANVTNGTGGQLDGNNDGTGGDNYVVVGNPASNTLFRLFGDIDGNGTVNGTDFLNFRLSYLGGNMFFDSDNSGLVTDNDFLQFRLRFLRSV